MRADGRPEVHKSLRRICRTISFWVYAESKVIIFRVGWERLDEEWSMVSDEAQTESWHNGSQCARGRRGRRRAAYPWLDNMAISRDCT